MPNNHGTHRIHGTLPVYLPTWIWLIFFGENVGKYMPYMDPMGITKRKGLPCIRDPGSPSENGSMEPKYYAFRR